MDVAPTLINFFAVQTLYPATKGRLLGGRYISLGALPGCLASACLSGAVLGYTHREEIDEIVRMFCQEPESGSQRDAAKAYLAGRVSERLDIYANENPEGAKEPASFLDFVAWTTKVALAAIGRHGRMVLLARPGEWVEPGEKAARALALGLPEAGVHPAHIYFSARKVSYDGGLVEMLAAAFVAEGIMMGASHAPLCVRMASSDLGTAQIDWRQAIEAGFRTIPERPPFSSIDEIEERVGFELGYFRTLRGSDPTGRIWGGSARAFPGEYKAWTERTFGPAVVGLYAFHTWKRLVEALRSLRDTGAL